MIISWISLPALFVAWADLTMTVYIQHQPTTILLTLSNPAIYSTFTPFSPRFDRCFLQKFFSILFYISNLLLKYICVCVRRWECVFVSFYLPFVMVVKKIIVMMITIIIIIVVNISNNNYNDYNVNSDNNDVSWY